MLYKSLDGRPSFKARWFWSPEDVRENRASQEVLGHRNPHEAHEGHELFCGTRTDENLFESVRAKCVILSKKNFLTVRKLVPHVGSDKWGKLFFCSRLFDDKALAFTELNTSLFPGDPIPALLMEEAGIVGQFDDVHPRECQRPYEEPRLRRHATRKRRGKMGQEQHTLSGGAAAEPFYIY